MTLESDLKASVEKIFKGAWDVRSGQVVPEPEDITLTKNQAVEFDRATILYADLSGSTTMVNTKKWGFAAEVYKTYLSCASTLIQDEGGTITSYDGDRVMAVWVGNRQSTPAAKCALKINYAVKSIINPALKAQYPDSTFALKQVVGIDTSPIRAARAGVHGVNDIVWVGRAANYAAKLTELDMDESTWITKDVFDKLADEAKFGGADGSSMWKSYRWTKMADYPIYGSTWWWRPD